MERRRSTWLVVAAATLSLVTASGAGAPSPVRQAPGDRPMPPARLAGRPVTTTPAAPLLLSTPVVGIDPVQARPGPAAGEPARRGAADDAGPITLHLDDVEVRKALELVSRGSSLNILVSPRVTGRVTANLQGLTLDQALDAILRVSNLVAYKENGLLYVCAPGEIAQLHENGRSLSTRVYHLKYVRGADIESMITPFLSPEMGKIAVTPMSEVGIATDTGKAGGDSLAGIDVVLVQDYEAVLQTVDQIVAQLDRQPVQVLIEAVIMECVLDHTTNLGVNFSVLDGARDVVTLLGNGAEINASVGFDPAKVLTAGGKFAGGPKGGFSGDTHGLKFGFVDRDVTGFVRALERVGKTNILASPRILVLNKQRAELIIGDKIGYKTLTVTETASVEKVEFLNVGTQLRLRPFVADDGMIRMEIHPERSTGEVDNGIPRTSTREVTTNVIVPDSCTIVIAGLMEDEEVVDQSGIPVLSRLRWVGPLFRQRIATKTKKELIVLLTPRIWNPAQPDAGVGPISDPALQHVGEQGHLETHWDSPGDGVAGETYHATLTITNHAEEPAEELRLETSLPDGAAWAPGSRAVLPIGTLAPNKSRTVETDFIPHRPGALLVRFSVVGQDNSASHGQQLLLVKPPPPAAAESARVLLLTPKPLTADFSD
jgi:type IV pilus secretin PilQ/predicted competence protein